MPTTASAGFIAALKSSLADTAVGWTVTAVDDHAATRVQSVDGTVHGDIDGGVINAGNGTVGGGHVNGTVASISVVDSTVTVAMEARGLSAAPGTGVALRLVYKAALADGAFQSALISMDGASLSTTDAALHATVMALAAAFNSARDTGLTTVLQAGAQTDVAAMPAEMLEAIKESLAGEAADWRVQARHDQNLPVTGPLGAGTARKLVSVALLALNVHIPAGSAIPLFLQYLAMLDDHGTLVDAQVQRAGVSWRTLDVDLYDQIIALGDAHMDASAADLTAALGA